ncbi:MAG TPA: glycosyl hydrolase [bacterium]|nr:glycosyl hydrolase [bacterium]HPN45681.1 glycosyl hydrolase [bacterium]
MNFKYILVFAMLLLTSALIATTDIIKPVTPNASAEATALLKFFYDISGKYTLTGQHNFPATKSKNSEFYGRYLGKNPVIFSSDFGFAADGDKDSYLVRPDIVKEAIKQHQAGALVALCWHAVPPTADEPVTFQPVPGSASTGSLASVQGRLTDEQFKELLTPGTAINKQWCKQVDTIAGFLKQLEKAHVPVLWRPYHEMNGDWFWWGGRVGELATKKLYIQLYKRLVEHHKLSNLIWVWSVDRPNKDKPQMNFANFFPGEKYVDVLALDVYGSDFNQAYYDSLNKLSNGKPMVLGEVGNPPSLEILQAQPRWSYWVIWAGMVRNTNKQEHIKLLQDPRMLVVEKQSYWDAAAAYHQACGFKEPEQLWIKPAVFKMADFSGQWLLNEEKSKFGTMGAGFSPYKLTITQSTVELTAERATMVEYDDDTITMETIKFDGSESISNSGFMGAPRSLTARWSALGDTLFIKSSMSIGQGDRAMKMESSEVWTIGGDGRILSIKQTSGGPWGKQESLSSYEKTCLK